jgi:hypothetical protein
MSVVGTCAFIISDTGQTADVKAYIRDYDSMQLRLRIVDAAVQYECPRDVTPCILVIRNALHVPLMTSTCILVIRNALHVPSMTNNPISPFMIREAGITVHDTPKI